MCILMPVRALVNKNCLDAFGTFSIYQHTFLIDITYLIIQNFLNLNDIAKALP